MTWGWLWTYRPLGKISCGNLGDPRKFWPGIMNSRSLFFSAAYFFPQLIFIAADPRHQPRACLGAAGRPVKGESPFGPGFPQLILSAAYFFPQLIFIAADPRVSRLSCRAHFPQLIFSAAYFFRSLFFRAACRGSGHAKEGRRRKKNK